MIAILAPVSVPSGYWSPEAIVVGIVIPIFLYSLVSTLPGFLILVYFLLGSDFILVSWVDEVLAFLIEHYGGAFPTWLAPIQVRALTVADRFNGYAEKIVADLRGQLIRAEVETSNDTLGKKIRNGTTAKIPNLLIIGEREGHGSHDVPMFVPFRGAPPAGLKGLQLIFDVPRR